MKKPFKEAVLLVRKMLSLIQETQFSPGDIVTYGNTDNGRKGIVTGVGLTGFIVMNSKGVERLASFSDTWRVVNED